MPSRVQFSFFGSFVFGTPEFPLAEIPLQAPVDRMASGADQAKPTQMFRFEEIQKAHRVMEASQANGKLAMRVRSQGTSRSALVSPSSMMLHSLTSGPSHFTHMHLNMGLATGFFFVRT
jgi:hypothetical protein